MALDTYANLKLALADELDRDDVSDKLDDFIDLAEALRFGPEAMADFEYEKFFYWFLDRNCLEPAKEEFTQRAWARIKDKAYL